MTRKEQREMDRLRAYVAELERERDRLIAGWRDQALRMIKAETTLARIRAELDDTDEGER
jgi:hypothetical protein